MKDHPTERRGQDKGNLNVLRAMKKSGATLTTALALKPLLRNMYSDLLKKVKRACSCVVVADMPATRT